MSSFTGKGVTVFGDGAVLLHEDWYEVWGLLLLRKPGRRNNYQRNCIAYELVD